jgi:hypothetical protein
MTDTTQPGGDRGQATCPKCESTSIQAVPVERKKIGEAVLAEYFLGTAAGVAAGSATIVQAICLKCGCQWFPGSEQERRLRALSGQLGDAARREEENRLASELESTRRAERERNIGLLVVLAILVVVVVGVMISQQSTEDAAWKARRQRDSVAAAVRDSTARATAGHHPSRAPAH